MQKRAGAIRALAAAALFGASTPAAKGLLGNIPPQVLAGLLYLGSGAGLGLLSIVRRRTKTAEAPLTRNDIPWLGGAILFGGVLAPLVVLTGLNHTPAAASALLLNLEGVFTALIAWFVFSENVDRRIALGMFAIVAGGAVLSWNGRVAWGGAIGPLLIVLGCLFWGVDNNFSQKVSAKDPVQITAIKGAVAGIVNLGIGLAATGAASVELAYVAGALVVGFLSYGLSLVLYVLAMRELGTARTGAYFSLAPFVGAAISLVVWHEKMSASFFLAGGLMAFGLWLHLSERHIHAHVHEPMTHTHRHVHDEHHQHQHSVGQNTEEPHSHEHTHETLAHAHAHFPDIHHRHTHDD